MSSLLSRSESLAFNGFLSAVDVSDVLEWSNAHAQLAEQLQPPRGKEALAKATKDLMSLDAPDLNFSTGHHVDPSNDNLGGNSFRGSGSTTTLRSTSNSSWPAFPSSTPQSSSQQYSYGFGAPGSASSWSQSHFVSPNELPHSHSDPSLRHHVPNQSPTSPSPFAVPDHNALYGQRPPSISQQSAPPGLSQPSGSSKRVLDESSDRISSKRRRSSTATTLNGDADMRPPPIVTLPSASSSSTRSASTSSSTSVTPTSEHPQQGGLQPRQTLLSPSQKRANHIQSEQKRRANIRRGYEALCDVVPALREAIKAEECTGNIPGQFKINTVTMFVLIIIMVFFYTEPSSSKPRAPTKKKKKGKGTADIDIPEDDSKSGGLGLDGRAGPRSENVVLQKSMYHLSCH